MACRDPQGFIIFPDPGFSESSVTATTEAGASLGPVVPAEGNLGQMLPVQTGHLDVGSNSSELELLQKSAGGQDSGAEWSWRKSGEGDEQWRGTDDPRRFRGYSSPFAGTANNENLAAIYSTRFNRIVLIAGADIRYRSLEGDYDSWSSATPITYELINASDTPVSRIGQDACELDDGTLLLLVHMNFLNPSTGLYTRDFDIYRSDNGGTTWRMVLSRLLLGNASVPFDDTNQFSKPRIESSGRFVRVCYVDTLGELHTMASSDRGASWVELPTLTLFTNDGLRDAYPFDITGYEDQYGKFLLVYQSDSTRYELAIAPGVDEWNVVTLGGSTVTGALMSLGVVRHQGYFVVWAWDENAGGGSNDSGWQMMRVKPDDIAIFGLNNAEALQLTHVARWRPCATNLISAGPSILSWFLLADSEVAGLWRNRPGIAYQGGWSQRSFGIQGRGWANPMFQNQAFGVDGHWGVTMGTPAPIGNPNASSHTQWTAAVAGGSQNYTEQRLRLTGTAPGHKYSFSWVQAVSALLGGWCNYAGIGTTFYWVMRTDPNDGAITSHEMGVQITSSLSSAVSGRIQCTARIAHDGLAIYDQNASGTVWSISVAANTFNEFHEFRLILTPNLLGDVSARLMWRKASSWAGDWEEGALTAALAVGPLAAPTNIMEFGNLGQTQSGSMQSYWREIGYINGDGKYRLGGAQNPNALAGGLASSESLYAQGNRSISWGGTTPQRGDTWDATTRHSHGAESTLSPSPSIYWESLSASAQELIFDAGENKVWEIRDIALIGTNASQATIDFSTDAAFTSPLGEVELGAFILDRASSLLVDTVSGNTFTWAASAAGNETPLPGSLTGMYVNILALSQSFLVTKHLEDGRVHLDTGGLSLDVDLGLGPGDKVEFFRDRMLGPVPDTSATCRYMRITFDGDPVGGTHKLGAVVPGVSMALKVPLEWAQTDNQQPNVTEYRTKSGVQWSYEEGPPQRTFIGRIVGDAFTRQNEQYRDRLRGLCGFTLRPVVLVLDDTDYEIVAPSNVFAHSALRTMIYGRITSGGQLEAAAWYTDDSYGGSLEILRQSSDVSINITEEV